MPAGPGQTETSSQALFFSSSLTKVSQSRCMESEEELSVPQKRFRYKSYQNELKDVHLPSALDNQSKLDQELDDNQSHFYEALIHWQQLNLSPSYINFVRKAGPISASLPLLLHNWKEVVELWLEALGLSDDEGLIQKLAQDLRSTIIPVYPTLLERLLQLPTRSIAPEALKIFISTLSSLFKYLVIPATNPELLEKTWAALRQTLPKCLPEIQRAIAEVWGSVLRKLKASLRERAIVLVAEDLSGIDDAAAWMFVSACKSVSQTLHTVTPSLINPLITFYLTCEENVDAIYTLIRRVFTAFIHHVKGPEQFTPITDIVVKNISSTPSEDNERLRRIMEVAAVISSVRNGSRLTSQNTKQLYELLPAAVPLEVQSALLKFSSALLTAGDMASWMSSARTFLAKLWENESMIGFTLRLHGVLAELGWGGWKMIAQPVLVKKSSKLLDHEGEAKETVRLLASLCRGCKMGEVDLVWKRRVEEWSYKRLKEFFERLGKLRVDEAAELDDILALSSYFTAKVTGVLVDIVSSNLELAPPSQHSDDFPSTAWAIGVCMRAIAGQPESQWSKSMKISSWTRSSIRNWAWSKNVMSGLVELSNASRQQGSDIGFEEVYSCAKDSILSHSRLLRLSTLKVLSSSLVKVPEETREALLRCLQGEEIIIDVQGVRERVLRIGKVEQVLKAGDDLGADLTARWLTAQLKVNLRPLWSPAAKALESHSKRFENVVWDLLFGELRRLIEGNTADDENMDNEEEGTSAESDDDPWEDERSWRDPSAHKLRLAVIQWNDSRPRLLRGSKPSENVLAEKHNRGLVPFFLSLNDGTETKLPRTKLIAWLSVFAKFQNPKALHSTDTLRSLYISLLSHPHRPLQSSALACPLTYKQRSLSVYEEKCRILLDDTRWRDELTMLDLSAVEYHVGKEGSLSGCGSTVGGSHSACWMYRERLKVNLRPLWSPAAKALESHSKRFENVVWDLLFGELRRLIEGNTADDENMDNEEEGTSAESDDDPWEDERSWRDPSAHKLRLAVIQWNDSRPRLLRGSKEISNDERYDQRSYELQLLSALGECSVLAEKHNRGLVPFFLSLNDGTETKLPRTKLIAWLSVFAKFQNPKALHSTDTLRSLYISLLSHPHRPLQSSALACLLTYKQRSLSVYEEKCRILLDDTRWRDELTMLDLSAVEESDRPEVVHVFVRLLFGIMLERKGRSRGADRRSAVLTALAGCTEKELGLLVELMLKPVSGGGHTGESGFLIEEIAEDASDKQVNGYLTLLGDVLKNLGPRLVTYWPSLLGTTINIIASAQARIGAAMDVDAEQDDEGEAEESAERGEGNVSSTKSARSIRQLGMKRLADFFRCPVTFDFAPYMEAAFPAFITPRIPALDAENTQAPSALLELFFVWSSDRNNVLFLVNYDERVVPKILDCLVAPNVKPAVISRIFDIVDQLLSHASEDKVISDRLLRPNLPLLLSNIATQIERSKGSAFVSTPLGQRQIGTLATIAQYSSSPSEASTLLRLFTPWLKRPSKVVPEKIKVDLLNIIGHLMQLIPELKDREAETSSKLYQLLSFLFQSLRSRAARLSLVATFHELAKIQVSLQGLAEVLESLNAYSTKRLDEPDFDRRLEAFNILNGTLHETLSATEWLPVLYNMLFYIHDPAELAIRSNASASMRHFIDIVATGTSPEYEAEFSRVLFPGLKNGLRSRNELARAEILGVISHAVHKCEHIAALQDMRCLLAGGDEEANFFNNILHVQLHRRSRALRRLADQCDENPMRNSTLSEIFLPLVANYIVATSTMDHHLVNDAINATGRLAKHLSWSSYYGLIQKYLRLSKAKDEAERVYVRTLVAVLENFHFVMEEVVEEEADGPGEDEDGLNIPDETVPSEVQKMARIADAVNAKLLPNLLQYLESRDATTEDTTRIPIAVGIVKVAQHLPQASARLQITRLLTVTSQIMRSKSQDTRDLTRDTLCRIAVVLGPGYLPNIFQELRGALLRGPHLHILATTVHHILVHVTTGDNEAQFSVIDNCVSDIAHVSSEVIFGESGKDVLAEGFKTKLREVKSSSSKGLDSFAITAKHISLSSVSALLLPLRSIMQETETTKIMQLVEDVLKSVANGLNSSSHITSTDLLSLCHTLITQNSRFLQANAPRPQKKAKNHVIVQTKRQEAADMDHYANNSFRFVVLGLDLLQTALRRSRFDFRESDIISRLQSIVVAVGNTLYSTNSPVLSSGLKVVAGLVKCPLDTLERSLPVFIRQILDIIKRIGNTESDVAQNALRTLAVVLRDGPAVNVKENDLTFLLKLISPDLEEPTRQGSVFQVLRAIISRKFVVPEIYDLMDRVSEVMVTNQSPQVQELCRSVLLQFLLDYPQGKGRLRNQMTFLAKNLSYVHESGRRSILELLSAIVTKFQVNLIREYADILFVSLVMVVANDDSAKCREMASHLIKSLVERFDEERRQTMMSHLDVWSTQDTQSQLVRVSSQVYGIVIDALGEDVSTYGPSILENMTRSLSRGAKQLASIESNDEDSMDVDLEWQTPYHSLLALGKLGGLFPALIKPSEDAKVDWKVIVDLLLFPHAWVRTAACRLLGSLYSLSPVGPPATELHFTPLSYDGMKSSARSLSLQLKGEHLDDALGLQIVKNLFFIGKSFAAIPCDSSDQAASGEEDDDDNEEKEEERPGHGNPLPWLFSTLSYQIRSALITRRNKPSHKANWSTQPMSVLRWFAAMASYLESGVLERFLVHILSPVYRITEDDTIHDPKMAELKDIAVELRDLVQSKVGANKFANVYNQIRQGALSVRQGRKEAKILQMATNPQAAAARKAHRNSVKKDSRKRKNQSFSDSKGKLKRRREG
ncbi:U3 snoRNP protein [Marasmius sp. AFHP31]|nr:U3 snoRNP protein [Marasmius sp. AFHP31]